jgi:transcriptional regulator of NAD metabolism
MAINGPQLVKNLKEELTIILKTIGILISKRNVVI